MTPVIEIERLQVKLGRRDVLRLTDVTRLGTSGGGKAIGLLGPNGAGKSTLIRTLLGFHKPSAGRAAILGLDCRTASRAVKARVGYMPETDAFVATQTAVRFLRIMGELSGLPRRVALERAHDTLFHVGLGEARYRPLGTYSVGMKQMAKLAQAIVHSPEFVILDEPTNGLDPAARSRMLDLVKELKDDHGMSVLLCSHLLRDVEEVCDEVIILKDGDIVHHADLEEERRSDRRFVELEVSGQDDGLAAALRACGAEGHSEGGGRWRVVLPPGVDVDVIWQLTAREELLVHHMTHRRDSLEQIFLKAVGHLDTASQGADTQAGTDTGAPTAANAVRTVADGGL
jgi:ABC-2 type transport system ATP-binding protein